jgi:hypothetical protein
MIEHTITIRVLHLLMAILWHWSRTVQKHPHDQDFCF